MDISTATTTVITLTLTEAEARTALSEPGPLLAQIRAVLAPIGAARALASGRSKRDPVIIPKAKAASSGRHYAPRDRKPRQKCGRMMTAQGLFKHLPVCTGASAKA